VLLTARDNAQTVSLSRERWPEVEVIGGPSPKARTAKGLALGRRVTTLARRAAQTRPDVALSHNSYAQVVAARVAGIPAVTAMDFEHQPANHLAFRLARTVLLPEVISPADVRRQGAVPRKVIRYPGLKEELYIGDFEPDPAILAKLGFSRRPRVLVVARTAPSRAVYHAFGNPLFEEALRVIDAIPGAVCVALARHPEQVKAIEAMHLSNCVIPRGAVDSRSLMYVSDALIGAGGTMTREAAIMGIPTWTLFAGTPPAADRWLERHGSLHRLQTATQLAGLGPRTESPRTPSELRARADAIERAVVAATLSAAR
jgi:predicted glycosyltransferase